MYHINRYIHVFKRRELRGVSMLCKGKVIYHPLFKFLSQSIRILLYFYRALNKGEEYVFRSVFSFPPPRYAPSHSDVGRKSGLFLVGILRQKRWPVGTCIVKITQNNGWYTEDILAYLELFT